MRVSSSKPKDPWDEELDDMLACRLPSEYDEQMRMEKARVPPPFPAAPTVACGGFWRDSFRTPSQRGALECVDG